MSQTASRPGGSLGQTDVPPGFVPRPDKPSYASHIRENDAFFRCTDALTWEILPDPIRANEAASNAGLSTIHEADRTGPLTWLVITSPNMTDRMPLVPSGVRQLKLYADGRAGPDDRTQHPQFYCLYFEYICCIPRSVPELPLLRWTPTPDDCPRISSSVTWIALRMLKSDFLNTFHDYRLQLSGRCRAWLENHPRPKESLLDALDSHMTRCLGRLANMGMTFKEIIPSVAEFQRACLDILGFLNFNMIYKNRSESTVWSVNPNLMGAFTEDFDTADKLHRRGIPVWFIRPSFRILPNMNVGAHRPFDPLECVVEDFAEDGVPSPFPIIRTCMPGTILQRCLQRVGVGILDLANPSTIMQNITQIPFQGGITVDVEPAPIRHSPYPTTASRPSSSVAGPSSPSVILPSSASRRGRHRGHGKPTAGVSRTTSQHLKVPPREHFVVTASPTSPPLLRAWTDALAAVDTTPLPRDSALGHRIGFKFPHPRALSSSETHFRHNVAAWAAIRALHTSNVMGGTDPQRLHHTDWRHGFHFFRQRLQPLSTPSNQTIPNGLNTYFTSLVAGVPPLTVTWVDQTVRLHTNTNISASVTDRICAEVQWDLHELNFRFDLLFLDQVMAPKFWEINESEEVPNHARLARDEKIRAIFQLGSDDGVPTSLIVSAIPNRSFGLNSESVEPLQRAVCLLRDLMRDWIGCPAAILHCSWDFAEELDLRRLEREVARFYCQSFYEAFGRAPCIPYALPLLSLSRPLPVPFLQT